RTEDFFASDAHIVVYIGKNGWLDEQPASQLLRNGSAAAGQKLSSVLLRGIDELNDAIELRLVRDGSHLGCHIQWISEANCAGAFRQRSAHRSVDRTVHEEPRPGDAGLACRREDTGKSAG